MLDFLRGVGEGLAKSAPAAPHNVPFLDKPFLRLTPAPADFLTFRELCEGTFICGSAGSGKSFIAVQALFRRTIRPRSRGGAGAGAVVTITREGDAETFHAWAKAEGRGDDVIIIEPDGAARMDIMADETSADKGLMIPANVRMVLSQVGELQGTQGGGGDNKFFTTSSYTLIENAASLLYLGQSPISLQQLDAVVQSAPLHPAELNEETYLASVCAHAINAADERFLADELSEDEEILYHRVMYYFTRTFPNMEERVRSSVVATYSTFVDSLLSGLTRQLFFADSPTLHPREAIDTNKIVLLNLPVRKYGKGAQLAQMLAVWQFGRMVENRQIASDDVDTPPFLFMLDEFQLYVVPSFFPDWLSTVRGARGMVVCSTQSLSALLNRLDASQATHQANAILANLQLKIAMSTSDPPSAQWFADAIGQVPKIKKSTNTGFSRSEGSNENGGGGVNFGASGFQALEHEVLPVQFSRLEKAHPTTRGAQAIIWRTSRIWEATNKAHVLVFLQLDRLLKG